MAAQVVALHAASLNDQHTYGARLRSGIWTRDGLNFAAVSDVDRRDLERMAGLMNPVATKLIAA